MTAVSRNGVPVRTLLPAALETFEYGLALLSEPRVSRWSWIWCAPNQIIVHLHFYLLEEICCRPCHPLVQRAWSCLDERGFKDFCNDVTKTSPNSLDAMFGILYSTAKRLKIQEAVPSTDLDKSLQTSQHKSQNIATTNSNETAPAPWAGSTGTVLQPMSNPAAAQYPNYNLISDLDAQGTNTQDSSMTRGFNGSLPGSIATSNLDAIPSHGQGSIQLEGISSDSGSLEFLSQSILTQDPPWLQFRDENMGVEEYTDGMWEALLTDLPTMV